MTEYTRTQEIYLKRAENPKNRKKGLSWLTKKEKNIFVREHVVNGLSGKDAYQIVRPNTSDSVAASSAARLKQDKFVKSEMQRAIEMTGMNQKWIANTLKTAVESGLGVQARNRDSIAGLKLLRDIITQEEDDTDKDDEELNNADSTRVLKMLADMNAQIEKLTKQNAQEAEIEK